MRIMMTIINLLMYVGYALNIIGSGIVIIKQLSSIILT